jgi:hypothetical protein
MFHALGIIVLLVSWNYNARDQGSQTPFGAKSCRQRALTAGHHSMHKSDRHATEERCTLVPLTPHIVEWWARWFVFLVARPRQMNQHG